MPVPTSRTLRRTLVAATLLALVSPALAQEQDGVATLKVGDPAPLLTVGKWVKGEPVKKFEEGTVYVLEFWATWCGPCVAAIPHVTEMQKKHEGKVVIIGANVWERDESKVAPFVEKMGEKMDYRVVMDDKSRSPEGSMALGWMKAAGQTGIPCSMIVDQKGKIAWIGHPMEMSDVLDQVAAGTYDPVKAAAAKAARENLQKDLAAKLRANDIDGAMKVLDDAAAADPEFAKRLPVAKFQILMRAKQYDRAYAGGDALLEAIKDEPIALNQLAWTIATAPGLEKRDLKLARKLAERAVEVTGRKDGSILDTLARVLFDSGEIDKAIEVQTEALTKAPDAEKAEMQQSLEKYKAAKK